MRRRNAGNGRRARASTRRSEQPGDARASTFDPGLSGLLHHGRDLRTSRLRDGVAFAIDDGDVAEALGRVRVERARERGRRRRMGLLREIGDQSREQQIALSADDDVGCIGERALRGDHGHAQRDDREGSHGDAPATRPRRPRTTTTLHERKRTRPVPTKARATVRARERSDNARRGRAPTSAECGIRTPSPAETAVRTRRRRIGQRAQPSNHGKSRGESARAPSSGAGKGLA